MAKLFGLEKRDVTVVPNDLFRSGYFGTNTPTGLSITPDSAMTVTSYFAAVRFHAFAVASLPKILYQRVSGGKRRVTEKSLYRVLHDQPNEDMTAFDLWATLDGHVMVRGNAYAEIVTDRRGEVTALWPLRPDKMEVTRTPEGELRYVYELPIKFERRKVTLLPEQVLHLRGLGTDGVMGLAPITMMRNAVGLAKATEEFGSAYFGNGAQPGVVLKHPGRFKDGEAQERVRASWEAAHQGLDNAHRAAILEEGMDVTTIGLSPEDSQFLQTRQFQTFEISRMTDVPPNMIFELSQSNYSTLEQMTLDFVVHHLRHWLVAYEQQCSRSLLMEAEKDAGYFVENLIDGLLRGDLSTRYTAYSIGKQNGWLSTNDIRRMENMNSIGAKGDKYLVPLNMSVLGDDGMPLPVVEKSPSEPNTPARGTPTPLSASQTSTQMPAPLPLRGVPPNIPAGVFGGRGVEILLRDAAERIGKREVNEYTTARQKHKRAEKFTAWAEQFYKRDYPQYFLQVLGPFFEAGMVDEEMAKREIARYCDRRGELALGEEMGVYVLDEIKGCFAEVNDGHE